MWERFKRWQPKAKRNHHGVISRWVISRWVISAIAAPAFIWLAWWLWVLPTRSPQPASNQLFHSKRAIFTAQPLETLVDSIGIIVMVAGGVFLFLNFRTDNKNAETADFSGVNFSGANLNGINLSGADLSGTDLSDANLSGANLSGANLNGADLINANLSGADLRNAGARYTNLSGANLVSANLSGADLRHANLSGADLKCTLINGANFSEANLSGALLFFVNSREVLNLEPFQLEANPSPVLCNVALPRYAQQPDVDPNRDCSLMPQLLSDRYDIPLTEAQGIVDEARQHRWN